MPLYKTITIDSSTRLYIWKIDESKADLAEGIELRDFCQKRLDQMKSDWHQRGFLSIRHLLKEAGYRDEDLRYDHRGKPHLSDNRYVSISHSFNFSAIIVSARPVGVDVEKQRDKILRIAHKFTPLREYRTLANQEAVVRKLTVVWGAKESIYKIMNIPGLLFLQHIDVKDFEFDDGKTKATVRYREKKYTFDLKFFEFEGFTCVYGLR